MTAEGIHLKLLNKIAYFVSGMVFFFILSLLVIANLRDEWLEKATHAYETGDSCSALENFYKLRIFEDEKQAFNLAKLFASGECVQQNFVLAEQLLTQSKTIISLADFYYYEAFELARTGNIIEDKTLRMRVSKLMQVSKSKGSYTPIKHSAGMNEEQLKLMHEL